jgi:hypothetical protein
MAIKLTKTPDTKIINVRQMLDGQIGEIVNWAPYGPDYIGAIVQRYGNILITIGKSVGDGWSSLFNTPEDKRGCLVRILDEGETLTITNNKG